MNKKIHNIIKDIPKNLYKEAISQPKKRLASIGDKILNACICQWSFDKPARSKQYQYLISNQILDEAMKQLDFQSIINYEGQLSHVFEALVGAYFLTYSYDRCYVWLITTLYADILKIIECEGMQAMVSDEYRRITIHMTGKNGGYNQLTLKELKKKNLPIVVLHPKQMPSISTLKRKIPSMIFITRAPTIKIYHWILDNIPQATTYQRR